MSDSFWFTTARLTVHLPQQRTGGMSLIEHRMANGFTVPLHVHDDEDENFYMLQGEMRLTMAEEVLTVAEGDALCVPAGVAHSFRVVSEEACFLTMTTGRFEQMIRSLARPALTPGLPPQVDPTRDQVDRLVAACESHGIKFVGPPVD